MKHTATSAPREWPTVAVSLVRGLTDSELESKLQDSELLEDVEYVRMRRISSEFAQVGGVRDF